MRLRASRAYNLYSDNMKIYSRLSNAKSTVPSVETLVRINTEHDKLLRSISNFKLKKSDRNECGFVMVKKEDPVLEMDKKHKQRAKTIKVQF